MKKKAFSKKLTLNKVTISELNKEDMVNARGGLDTIGCATRTITVTVFLDCIVFSFVPFCR